MAIPFYRRLYPRLVVLIIVIVVITEVLVFIPSTARLRDTWLQNQYLASRSYIRLLDISDSEMMSQAVYRAINHRLMAPDKVLSISTVTDGKKNVIISSVINEHVTEVIHIGQHDWLSAVRRTMITLVSQNPQIIMLTGIIPGTHTRLEVVISDHRFKNDIIIYMVRLLINSSIIAFIVAFAVYLTITTSIINPARRIYRNMLRFVMEPDNPERIIVPDNRQDEVGIVQRKIAEVEGKLFVNYRRQKHLINLGLAVSKINHDIRNILASAQLLADRLEQIEDPAIRKIGTKLTHTVNRAIDYSQSVITYSGSNEALPVRTAMALYPLIEDIKLYLVQGISKDIDIINLVPKDFLLDGDSEQLHRVITNLCFNAVQAMNNQDDNKGRKKQIIVRAQHHGKMAVIDVMDNGPGLSKNAKRYLFSPFMGSTKSNGTGLGLSICDEIIRGHGGTIALIEEYKEGAHFEIRIPAKSMA